MIYTNTRIHGGLTDIILLDHALRLITSRRLQVDDSTHLGYLTSILPLVDGL